MSANRLLFVDDDAMVLAGLRRALREMREDWEMVFATSGQEALALLEAAPCDAIVTDLRMPGMDGAELLERVKDRCPGVIRIILSGQPEKDAMLRSIVPAHQYLAKPCDVRELKLRLTQALASRDLVHNPAIAAAVARLRSVPSMPAIYHELGTALRSEMTSLVQIEEIVARDVGMASKILQLANSAFIEARGRVYTLRQALSLIGIDTVRTLTLSIHVFSRFVGHAAIAAEVASLWEHSAVVASLAQSITKLELRNKAMAEEAFAGGLLHDIGKVILLSERPEECREIRKRLNDESVETSVEEIEIELLGCSHAQLGGYLMSIWGLPTALVDAVALHHQPSQGVETEFSTLTAVHCANALVHQAKQDGEKTALDEAYLARLGLAEKVDSWRGLLLDEERTTA